MITIGGLRVVPALDTPVVAFIKSVVEILGYLDNVDQMEAMVKRFAESTLPLTA
ncbi:MAG: hypothetical protein KTR35_06405 [Gammaproteobacteria bacterium]|nr:hypothetical protein [Gammaproteobacteria bacterium]